MDITSNNTNQNNTYSTTPNYQGNVIDNNYMNGGKSITPYGNTMANQSNGNMIQSSPPQYIPQNNNQTFWNGNYNAATQGVQPIPVQSNIQNQNGKEFTLEKEFILLDGSTPNKKRKYVFVGEIDITQPVFSLEDIRKIVSDEFDRRFGEEEHS